MITTHRISRFIVLALIAGGLGAGASAASDKASDDAKAYQASLEALKGQPSAKVMAKLGEWKFELLDKWSAENPTAKDVSRHNRSRIKFSKDEVAQLFGPGGQFTVLVCIKRAGGSAVSMGEIDQMGLPIVKDSEVVNNQFCVIRTVFKSDGLVDFRIWPKLDQSAFTGGTYVR